MKHYETLADLPQSLKDELPELAQQTYLATYRETWTKCHMSGVTSEAELAKTAHEAAMLAVQRQFAKDDEGRWRQSPVGSEIDPDKLEGRAPDHE